MISCQRELFSIPDDVAYLNTAYMSPLMHSVVEAVDRGVRMKSTPWTLTIPDFYDAVDRARDFFNAALSGGVHEDTLTALEQAARNADDSANGGGKLLRTLAEALAAGGQGSRDGGRTRSALLRRAAYAR